MINDRPEEAETAPAELTWPIDAGPTRRRELAIPAQLALPVGLVLIESPGQRLHPLVRGVGFEPSPQLAAKGLILGAIVEVHRCNHLAAGQQTSPRRVRALRFP